MVKFSVYLNRHVFIMCYFISQSFQLIGLAVAAVGFILRFGKALWEDALKTGINLLKKVGDDTQLLQNLDTDNLDIGSIVQTLAIGLIVGGLVLCVISVVGCCGACYKIKIMLWIVSFLITVNPLFTDTRYNDKIRYNENFTDTNTSLKR